MSLEKSRWPERVQVIKRLRFHSNGVLLAVRSRRGRAEYIEKKYDQNTDRALQEVQHLREIRHEYIHNVIDARVGDDHEWASIWLEAVADDPLSKLIDKHDDENLPIFEYYCWKIFFQVASAMRYCHHGDGRSSNWHPIIHRNLKPDNILLTAPAGRSSTPNIKITGFEHAIWVDCPDDNQVSLAQVSPKFAPPESPQYSEASDVYQIGCIMLCMLNLEQEPGDLTTEATQYSEQLLAVVQACLKRSPEHRYSSDMLATLVDGGFRNAAPPIQGRLLLPDGPLEVGK